jgi:hypothetical protein
MVVPKFCPPTVAAISELFAQGFFSVTSIATASRLSPSKLCRIVTTMLTTYQPCCIVVRLLPASIAALSLHPWAAMPMPPPVYVPQPPTSAVTSAPIPAPVTPPGPLLIVECATQRSLRPPTMSPPTSAVTSAPIPAPVTPPGPLLIVECATQRSLRPPGLASDNATPPASPLRVNRVYGLQVAPPSLHVPADPLVLHHQMDVDRDTQHRRPSHFVDALFPSGDDPPSITPPGC